MQFEHVLLVDDDPIFNHLHTRLLDHTKMVANSYTALHGGKAIDFLKTFYAEHMRLPDAILLDLDMPVMNGFEFMEEFRKMNLPGNDKVVIILITSSSDPRDAEKARSMRIRDHLIKPVPLPEMIRALQSAIEFRVEG